MAISIAIDGPAGAGKSTISKEIAKILNLEYIDTGAMYRALTHKILKFNIDLEKANEVKNLLSNTSIDFVENHIILDGEVADHLIRASEINNLVSKVASLQAVRIWLVEKQQKIAKDKNIIMDGRDIGTHVLKDASVKIYLNASDRERGLRRYKELKEKDEKLTLDDVILSIQKRDYIDSNREFSPLRKAADAIEVDTTSMTIEETIAFIVEIIEKVIANESV